MNRRTSLYLMGGAAASVLAGWKLGSAFGVAGVLTPEQEQGPFYIPKEKMRRDIREDRPGLPLDLSIALVDAVSGHPLSGAAVDIWHCDAGGVYSGFAKMAHPPGPGSGAPGGDDHHGDHHDGPGWFGGGGGPGFGHLNTPTDTSSFLRGVQITNENGVAFFTTIYPGWYMGREIHIHMKVYPVVASGASSGTTVCHTGQIFFPDEINAIVSKTEPYVSSTTPRTTKSTDHVYRSQNGARSVATLLSTDSSRYVGTIMLGVDPKAVPRGA